MKSYRKKFGLIWDPNRGRQNYYVRADQSFYALYLMNSCTQAADVAGRQHLRSASQRKMIVPRYRLDSYGRWCVAVVGPSTWNSLPDSLRDPALSFNIFRRHL